MPSFPHKLVPASHFTLEELTEAYNQTRVDYMVPMPMNVARLTEYVETYDVDLDSSFVAMNSTQMLGLGMLGVRPKRSWITRLGILPVKRRNGAGEAIVRRMLDASADKGIKVNILEVIKGNVPAHSLFRKLKFEETRELTILRRPPIPPGAALLSEAQWFEKDAAMECLPERNGYPAWTNETESLANADHIYGLRVDLNGHGRGWLVFQRQQYNLSRIMYHTEDGDPAYIMTEMLNQLHSKYPTLDTYTENVDAADPLFPAFEAAGYFEVFRRVEMVRKL